MQSIAIGVFVGLSVRSRISKTPSNFHFKLPVAVAQSSSDNTVIRYVLPVLWARLGLCDGNRADA